MKKIFSNKIINWIWTYIIESFLSVGFIIFLLRVLKGLSGNITDDFIRNLGVLVILHIAGITIIPKWVVKGNEEEDEE